MIKNNSKTKYSNDFKEQMVKRMLPPENISPHNLSKISGVSKSALYKWLKKTTPSDYNKSSKNKVEWVSTNFPIEFINNNKPKSEIIKVNIGRITLEIEDGFNKTLLLDLLRVVDKI